MESAAYGHHRVFLYGSMLFTRSPLLQQLYAESHCYEPWLIQGQARRWGHLVFPGALYVDAGERRSVLAAVAEGLDDDPGFAAAIEGRVIGAVRRLVRTLARVRRAPSATCVEEAFVACAQVLSTGVLKEALDPASLEHWLGRRAAVQAIRPLLPQLYQPRCLSHFVKLELKLLFFAARWKSGGVAARAARTAGYLQRFLLEDGPLDSPAVMGQRLESLWQDAKGRPANLVRRRAELLRRHEDAVRAADQAEHQVLQTVAAAGRMTLRARRSVLGALQLVRLAATTEELKHILTLRTARALRGVMETQRLPLATTGYRELVESFGGPL